MSSQKDALLKKLSSPDRSKERRKKWQRESKNEDMMEMRVVEEDTEEYK